MRHSFARNTIERTFGLKKRWSILRNASFFPKKIQICIIIAYFIVHKCSREETKYMQEVEQELEVMEAIDVKDEKNDFISTARSTNEWTEFRDQLDKTMFDNYVT